MSKVRGSAARRIATLESFAPLFAALGDETRLKLMARLRADGRTSITHLTSGTDVTRQAITKHLHVLADAGLVKGTRRGRERLWELEPSQLENARRCLDLMSERWDEALGRLRASVES